MQDVNIYIETSIHGPARKNGEYLYILECFKGSEAVTGEGRGRIEASTENQLALTALSEALGRLNCPCDLKIYTSCGHIIHSMQNSWARQWQKNGWRKAGGAEVRNAALWAEVLDKLDSHLYIFSDQEHSYSEWMKEQLKTRRAE